MPPASCPASNERSAFRRSRASRIGSMRRRIAAGRRRRRATCYARWTASIRFRRRPSSRRHGRSGCTSTATRRTARCASTSRSSPALARQRPGGVIDETQLLESAPDLDIAGNRVRLEGLRYRIELALPGAAGELTLDAAPGRSLPPATLHGARGWLSGYVAPVLSGTVRGSLTVGGDRIAFENAVGYHDHN